MNFKEIKPSKEDKEAVKADLENAMLRSGIKKKRTKISTVIQINEPTDVPSEHSNSNDVDNLKQTEQPNSNDDDNLKQTEQSNSTDDDISKIFEQLEIIKEYKYSKLKKETYQSLIFEKYKKFKLESVNQTIEETCNRTNTSFSPTKLQSFLYYYYPKHTKRGILLYHGIGSGKTFASVLMAKSVFEKGMIDKVVVLLPAALKTNFANHVKIISSQIKGFSRIFTYTSYNGRRVMPELTSRTLVIIDECQNLTSMMKNRSSRGVFFYGKLMNSACRIIAMSATPVINTGYEFAVLFSILSPGSFRINGIEDFTLRYYDLDNDTLKNRDQFYSKIVGLVSYYKGVNEGSEVYPSTTTTHEVLDMTPEQAILYLAISFDDPLILPGSKKKVLDLAAREIISGADDGRTFKVPTRQASTVVFPNGISTLKGLPDDHEGMQNFLNNYEKYSVKFAKVLEHISNSKGPVMVYSFFVDKVLYAFEKILEHKGISFVKWIGGQDQQDREAILTKFNSLGNKLGTVVKVFIVSSAGAEGISLKNVRQVHLLEPYWNEAKVKQILGRAVRLCSHVELPSEDRVVDIYRYITRVPDDIIASVEESGFSLGDGVTERLDDSMEVSIDTWVESIAYRKEQYDASITTLVKESALDCKLNAANNTDVQVCIEDYYGI
jgi:SNF2 family DNA or RNA helicase